MKKYINKQTVIVFAIVLAGVSFFGFRKMDNRNFQLAKNISIFSSIVKELDMFYVDTLDANKTLRTGIDAMLMSLDPYTNYFPEEDQSELEQMIKGTYGGIGSLITYDPKRKRSVIAEPYENMPAAEVGLKAGDVLLEIDGKDLTGKNNSEVSEMLRGQVNTSLKVKVERPGTKKPIDFDIVRKSIQLPIVPYNGMIDDGIGYINLNSFSGKPAKEFKEAFLELKKTQNLSSLVIDLRNNSGGLLDEAVEIANYFVPRGEVIVTTKGRIKQTESTYKTRREPLDTDLPIVVLVNNGTASSSEILAGALQDMDRAVVIGTRTFGKGLVQTTRALPYGGALKITVSKYYTPSGRCVQAIDYNHRNADGSIGRIPDSLTTAYRTLAGREVRDGGGINPDIVIKPEKIPNILFYLLNDNLIFNYATDYALKHQTIAPAESFAITDADYQEFKELVQKSDFKYDQQSGKLLKTLKETAEFEGYLDNASEEFAALENKLSHNLNQDLDHFADEIKDLINNEIVKRYYFQKGGIIQQLKSDPDLKEAVKVLKDSGRYSGILSPNNSESSEAV
ncbi:S41 family peptidase [Bacteroides sp. 519]|uniref:S41 family peptidase n=1 Tax=Bacteroides sp. 519 TaxID=2302937 RepID=UPI0013D666CC|nr:S41 family peptidase [Bacteroides sp. 519]NDV57608.1 S41 family peptidase [Bacteroides sp. 519]